MSSLVTEVITTFLIPSFSTASLIFRSSSLSGAFNSNLFFSTVQNPQERLQDLPSIKNVHLLTEKQSYMFGQRALLHTVLSPSLEISSLVSLNPLFSLTDCLSQ